MLVCLTTFMQSFCQYRGKLSQKSPEELELLKETDKVGAARAVGRGSQGGLAARRAIGGGPGLHGGT